MDLFLLSRTNKAILPSLSRFLLFSSLLFFSSFVFANKALSTQQQCVEDHFSALLHLKQGFYFSEYSKTTLSSWNPDNRDCCSWEGITCDGATGHVISLDLSYLQISGLLDFESVFHLQSLQRLNLARNDFVRSPIPSGFDKLTSLTHLNLSRLHFYGQIPLEKSLFSTSLVSLDLSYSQHLYVPLELLQNLSSLSELYLDLVNIPRDASEWSLDLFSALPSLRKLSLSYCRLSGPILSSLSKLRFLSELDLSGNNLSSVLPNFIGNFSSLTSLSLGECGLHGKFPISILRLANLQSLILHGNPLLTGYLPEFHRNSSLQWLELSNTGFSGKLPESLGNLKQLTMIHVGYCNLSGTLPSSLANLNNLIYLDLSNNGFSGPIPFSHGHELQNLKELLLHNNFLSGTIPASLFSLPSLQILLLRNNQFSGQLGEFQNASSSLLEIIYLDDNSLEGPIPKSIFELTKLIILDLSSNNLSGIVDLGLFQNLKNLTTLNLSENSLSVDDGGSNSTFISFPHIQNLRLRSCNISKFPTILINQEQLTVLDLSNNRINGAIPKWIWQVANDSLSYLNLSHNSFEGFEQPFPHSSLSSLAYLDLSFNKLEGSLPIFLPSFFISLSSNNFSGEVPSLICNRTSLQVLDLSNNRFNGSIPSCLGEISDSLTVLNLGGNEFHGTFLQRFKEGCILETLDLNGNWLEGQVPRSLANCKMLEVLNIGNNQIHDTFPVWLENLSQLRVLILRSNKFHGTIGNPQTNYTFPLLQIFDLSSNSFTGSLPSNLFKSWKAMMEEDKSQSQFLSKGSSDGYYQDKVTIVSKGLEMELVKILTAFTVVDLSNNQFDEDIPESVGDLKSLHVLNMSYNCHTGQIPASLGNIKELESLDLSHNNLSGEISLQLTKLTFLAVLNLSQNLLVGKIPQGQQFNTFTNESFLGNLGLCGPPLMKKCEETEASIPSTQSKSKYDWESVWIGFGVGYGVGMGILFWTLALWTKGKREYIEFIDRMLLLIFPWEACNLLHRH